MAGLFLVLLTFASPCYSQDAEKERLIDQRVKKFLDKMKNRWRDSNVPKEINFIPAARPVRSRLPKGTPG
jgi:hypothetical protein